MLPCLPPGAGAVLVAPYSAHVLAAEYGQNAALVEKQGDLKMETRRLLVYYKNIQAVSLKYSVRFKEGPETPTAFL